jgi:hypothetical protein
MEVGQRQRRRQLADLDVHPLQPPDEQRSSNWRSGSFAMK